jgi:hypothetical protein
VYNRPEHIRCCWQRTIPGPIPYQEKHWLEYGVEYSVTALQQQDLGGILTLSISLPPEASQFVIRRRTPKTQETDFHNGARLPAELIEGIADKSTMEIQELSEQTLDKDLRAEIMQQTSEAIDAEAAARLADDATLQSNIDAEAATRLADDTTKIDKAVAGDTGKLLQDFAVKEDVATSLVLTKTELDVSGSLPPSPVEMALPLASEDRAGVMPKESFTQILNNTQRIELLENKSLHYAVSFLSETPTQQELQSAYETASGNTGPAPDLTTLDDQTFRKSYTWYGQQNAWQDMGASIITLATNAAPGSAYPPFPPGKAKWRKCSTVLNG